MDASDPTHTDKWKKGTRRINKNKNKNLEWRRSPQLFRFSPAILHLATCQPGRDVTYPYPPDRYAIARDTRLEPRERLRTLFSRILFNSGAVDRFLGGVCEIYHRNRNKQLETMKV